MDPERTGTGSSGDTSRLFSRRRSITDCGEVVSILRDRIKIEVAPTSGIYRATHVIKLNQWRKIERVYEPKEMS